MKHNGRLAFGVFSKVLLSILQYDSITQNPQSHIPERKRALLGSAWDRWYHSSCFRTCEGECGSSNRIPSRHPEPPVRRLWLLAARSTSFHTAARWGCHGCGIPRWNTYACTPFDCVQSFPRCTARPPYSCSPPASGRTSRWTCCKDQTQRFANPTHDETRILFLTTSILISRFFTIFRPMSIFSQVYIPYSWGTIMSARTLLFLNNSSRFFSGRSALWMQSNLMQSYKVGICNLTKPRTTPALLKSNFCVRISKKSFCSFTHRPSARFTVSISYPIAAFPSAVLP